jgi:gamma-glutamyltranspeptidase/glutathione hydrolase
MVASQNSIASQVGVDAMRDGGSAVDAAVAAAFALAVTHPAAGNIGGGGFLMYRPASGEPIAYDFREKAPATATQNMWLVDGEYDPERHHQSHLAVGVPGTVAGLHMAWQEHGKLPWKRVVTPAVQLARDGFVVTHELSRSLKNVLPRMKKYPSSLAAFTKQGVPFEPGDILKQPDLAKTLTRIEKLGPAGFYEGKTADLVEAEMNANGGLITKADLKAYTAERREPLRGTYRDFEVLSMPPPSSGGTAVIEMLNILEGYDLVAAGFGSARNYHRYAESMRRAFADRARFLGDPDWNPDMPIKRLTSKEYANQLRGTIQPDWATKSSDKSFSWRHESPQTTHLSVVDANRNAVALTYTLEYAYGSAIVVTGGGFILNNEMGDFNPQPGLTNDAGLIGTVPNLTAPGKRMLSSMTPTIVVKDDDVFMVTGSPGGRTIINTVLQTIVNVVDFGMNAQEAVDAGRMHHQWLPDRIAVERYAMSPDTKKILRQLGHDVVEVTRQGAAQVIVVDPETNMLNGGNDRRVPDGAVVGY